jgi:hypothetical protein
MRIAQRQHPERPAVRKHPRAAPRCGTDLAVSAWHGATRPDPLLELTWDWRGKRGTGMGVHTRMEPVIAIVKSFSLDEVTGHIGDGKIFVLDVAQAARIRTGEQGAEAL